jgi:chromosome segregation ATPase
MQKLSKRDLERIKDAATRMEDLQSKVEEIVTKANSELEALVEEFEDARHDAFGALDDICNEAQDYFDERSEKWQDGDKGDQYRDWISSLEEVRDHLDQSITLSVEFAEKDEIEAMVSGLANDIKEAPDEM